MTLGTVLGTPGRPGVYLAPARAPDQLRPERLDVAGFVGVALRGPVDEPVRVTRWSDYVRVFGGFEPAPGGPVRLLPHAVAAFFRQGGQVAQVLRVAPHGPDDQSSGEATATWRLKVPGGTEALLRAASEGSWGNELLIRLSYRPSQRTTATVEEPGVLRLPPGTDAPVGTLLRLGVPAAGDPGRTAGAGFRWVVAADHRLRRGDRLRIEVDRAVDAGPGGGVAVEIITGILEIEDRSAAGGPERLTGVGLRPGHPRWLADLLTAGPHLAAPAGDWTGIDLAPASELGTLTAELAAAGKDRCHLIDGSAFFDPGTDDASYFDDGDDDGPDAPSRRVGVDRLAQVREIGLLCVPDLGWTRYRPAAAPAADRPASRAPCRCCGCEPAGPEPVLRDPEPRPTGLDARNPADLDAIVDRQQRVVGIAGRHQRFVVLLDVPDGLSMDRIARWRSFFDSGYAAAYHPWLAVPDGPDGRAVAVPPSAFAAGIVAARELRLGLPWGPANELAVDAVRAAAVVTDATHDRLHALGVNVFRAERDGFRLTAARTLSSDPDYRQLSVRRLITMIRLSLDRQTQWLAFEPNTAELRQRLYWLLTGFLRDLARRGAFAGATEAESFFVRCGDDLNPPSALALGRLVAEIGVAPAVPLEYIMVRIARDPDGNLAAVPDGR